MECQRASLALEFSETERATTDLLKPKRWAPANVESADRIIYVIFSRPNDGWKTQTLKLFT
jgi:hypothetical protein